MGVLDVDAARLLRPRIGAQPPDKAKDDKSEPAGDKVDIKWKFEKDKPFYQEMTTKTTQDMKVMGMDVNQKQDQTFYFSWTLKDEDKDRTWSWSSRSKASS